MGIHILFRRKLHGLNGFKTFTDLWNHGSRHDYEWAEILKNFQEHENIVCQKSEIRRWEKPKMPGSRKYWNHRLSNLYFTQVRAFINKQYFHTISRQTEHLSLCCTSATCRRRCYRRRGAWWRFFVWTVACSTIVNLVTVLSLTTFGF